jgi:Putative porin
MLAVASIASPATANEKSSIEHLEAIVRAQERRIVELEKLLQVREPGHTELHADQITTTRPYQGADKPEPRPRPLLEVPRLAINGDVRIRYEANSGEAAAPDRHRAVIRARLRGDYILNDWLSTGAQLTTGDPDDPNSTDVTLDQFNDDLMVSLDQAYLRLHTGQLDIHVGKIPLPFIRTDLVWDGDVNPGGASLVHHLNLGKATLRTAGLWFVVDEAPDGPDSWMIGGQVAIALPSPGGWRADAAVGYYDYVLNSIVGADSGDFRTNRTFGIGDARRYRSDFDLVDLVASVSYDNWGPKRQIRLSANYVLNLEAESCGEDGFQLDVAFGRLDQGGDWRGSYMYAQADPDAVLAAFSHDSTTLGSNYVQHGLTVEHALTSQLFLNATLYRFRPKLPIDGIEPDWRQRLRLNVMASF